MYEHSDYLREQAARYLDLAKKEENSLAKKEFLELADICEEVANDRRPARERMSEAAGRYSFRRGVAPGGSITRTAAAPTNVTIGCFLTPLAPN